MNKVNNKVVLFDAPENIDQKVVFLARVSSENQDNPKHERLIKYPLKEGHFSPFDMVNITFKVGESIWCPSIVGNGNPIEIIEVIGSEIPVLETKYTGFRSNMINQKGLHVPPLACFKLTKENKELLSKLYPNFNFSFHNQEKVWDNLLGDVYRNILEIYENEGDK